jgi:hypothetical protein
MTIGASRDSDLTLTSPVAVPRRHRALHAAPAATPVRSRAVRSPLTVRDRRDRRHRRADAGTLIDRYRSLAISSDAAAAAVATVVSLVVRYGIAWPLAYVAISLLVPIMWIGLVALQRGYESRFLGTGPEEYRRAGIASLALFTLIAVASFVLRRDISRGYVLITVPAVLLLSLVGRHLLRAWIARLRVAGHGLQRVLVVGRTPPSRSSTPSARSRSTGCSPSAPACRSRRGSPCRT